MFKQESNATLNNSVFNLGTIVPMHETTKRLYRAAEAMKKTVGQSAVARLLNASPQTVKNWEKRGVSKGGMVDAERMIGCRSSWIENGEGDMATGVLLLSDTQKDPSVAESLGCNSADSDMLYSLPKTVDSDAAYTIRQYAAGGSMGHGLAMPDQPGVIENWSVSREWLQKNVRTHTGVQNLCIVTGFGPSMQPMFNPGDPLLVDTGVSSVIADGVYFFRVGSEAFIKQLQKIPTADGLKYVAKSKNKDYDDFEITQDMDFEVLGRVVRVWCGTNF